MKFIELKCGSDDKCKLLFSNMPLNNENSTYFIHGVLVDEKLYVLTFTDELRFFDLEFFAKCLYRENFFLPVVGAIVISSSPNKCDFECIMLDGENKGADSCAHAAASFALKYLDYLKDLC